MKESDPSKPLGHVLQAKKIGRFLFVDHDYPQLAERASHSHPWLHLAIVRQGFYSRKLGRRSANYRAGSLGFLQTNESHADSYAAGSKCLHVVIPSDVERKLARDFSPQLTAEEVPPSVGAGCAVALQREFRYPDSDSPMIVEALLLDLISRYVNVIRERSSARPSWLGLLLDYLDDTFEQGWSLHNMAAEVGVHPVYLCRSFSEQFDCTLGEYIRKLRILRGWQLLMIGNSSLAQVASQSGFADQSHFTRLFKEQFGLTPGEYRRLSPRGTRPTTISARADRNS